MHLQYAIAYMSGNRQDVYGRRFHDLGSDKDELHSDIKGLRMVNSYFRRELCEK